RPLVTGAILEGSCCGWSPGLRPSRHLLPSFVVRRHPLGSLILICSLFTGPSSQDESQVEEEAHAQTEA
ncbi:hypothetical protein GDO78_000155, partial [Eleutherodactylus coqui]